MRGVEIGGWMGWLFLGCEGVGRHGDQLEGVFVWKKQNSESDN